MKYPDGKKVKFGDRLELWPGSRGKVVAVIDEERFSTDYPKASWDYLKTGVLILSDEIGLIHYVEPEETFVLVSREETGNDV